MSFRAPSLAAFASLLGAFVACAPAPGVVAVTAPGGSAAPLVARHTPRRLTLTIGAFSSVREVLGTRVLPRFARHWLRTHGDELRFVERYEGSGALVQATIDGFAADVVWLASIDDVARLVAAGCVRANWADAPDRGIVSRSLVVLAVRKGNPHAIRDWADLARPGLAIVTPDPATSGGGRWNVCALYGAALRGRAGVAAGHPAAAIAFVQQVFANVVDRRASANDSYVAFQAGLGDVAITCESEVVGSWQFGHDEERVVPGSTVLVEHPATIVDRNADRDGVRAVAEGLLQFLRDAEGQRLMLQSGLRLPAASGAAVDRPLPGDLWTIDDLGGWTHVVDTALAPAGLLPAAVPGK